MSVIASLAIALSLFTGAPAISAPADVSLTYDSPVVSTVAADQCEEDEPCWNCETMGNHVCGHVVEHPNKQEDDPGWDCYEDGDRVCGPQEEGLEREAWTTFDPSLLPQSIIDHGFKAEYMGTMHADAPFLQDSWHVYTIASPGLYNVFSIQL